ncbi:fungal specific transcription factor [Hirsutella rhossiliensis]|uniref:Fungal specific transcription factor domain-containing protein n=1 Tax=Hirsutella rhossiliensis TaxID=111463 RepID=A0A9P8N4Z4_9HYPO|nr:fungal specific transcription factor domain-containing protein [Hirsutella rhossiliensis]KAH0968558.1 fungal specific transcription factor domain-containing protein [Hirsutella rhossiliensis]
MDCSSSSGGGGGGGTRNHAGTAATATITVEEQGAAAEAASTALPTSEATSTTRRYMRSRVANACDGCKARKVRCDGRLPCGYCAGRQRASSCSYSPQRRRPGGRAALHSHSHSHPHPHHLRQQQQQQHHHHHHQQQVSGKTPPPAPPPDRPDRQISVAVEQQPESEAEGQQCRESPTPTPPLHPPPIRTPGPEPPLAAEDETDVPREARLLCDAHGKLVFIGDCAPLSFFQSVRQLVTTRVGQNSAFAPESSRYSVLENAASSSTSEAATSAPDGRRRGRITGAGRGHGAPEVRPVDVAGAVAAYLSMTTGLIDLFDRTRLVEDLVLWANLDRCSGSGVGGDDDVASVVNYLVLAIGRLLDDEELSRAYFEHARDRAYASLSGCSLGVGTVQAFALVTIYMLCSCQLNGAFLFFGIAVRAAYSIGVHRTEVNARFGQDGHRQRDRLWKSLRVVDLFLSTSMGRPPATSDVDCTVSYRCAPADEGGDLLDASVQILLITECIVLEVYSRRKISLQLTEGISRQLRDWSVRWLPHLKDVVAGRGDAQAVGACQVLASYYYAVMLVSRPFLMYELCRRLSDGGSTPRRALPTSGRTKLADACIDAASLMVDSILDLVDKGLLNVRVPLMVSWLFASSLVLGVGLLGGFGCILEKYSRMSIQGLDHFSKTDGHATQYSLIAQSLLATALEYLERQELEERQRRTESSSQLFGLMPPESRARPGPVYPGTRNREGPDRERGRPFWDHQGMGLGGGLGDAGSGLLGFSESLLQTPPDGDFWNGADLLGAEAEAGSALNLFPLLEAGGGIDLAHYL